MPKVVYTSAKGLVTEAGAGFTITNGPLSHGSETVTNAAATSPSKPLSLMAVAAGSPATLMAAGTDVGQIKRCVVTSIGGTQQDLTPSNLLGASTLIRFSLIGQSVTLVWTGAAWAVIDRAAAAAGAVNATSVANYPVLRVAP